jgi:alkanesulfonate monooxygenase SsuD/methylene tetrahydromethanopterin reductase-like flavin-dependent oxidoreductase (luciferase family)
LRFGTYLIPQSPVPDEDSVVIDSTLAEVELAEELGFDTVWLQEHHFGGECAYADPLVFGAAVAARTERIKIGFAVIQMALHHPVRLAEQTALLDNLSHGRLIVGTGRGTVVNHFEYTGFGTTMDKSARMLAEAEELLVKAWTEENIDFQGEFWQSSMPMLRPRPYQKPHPPIVRASISEESIKAMALIGRPVMLGPVGDDILESRVSLYKKTLGESGLSTQEVDRVYDQVWVAKKVCIAPTETEAIDTARAANRWSMELTNAMRRRHNPPEARPAELAPDAWHDLGDSFVVGTPEQVAEQISMLRDIGVPNLMLTFNLGNIPRATVERSMRLFANEVAPEFAQPREE